MDGNTLAANFIATTRWESLPEPVRRRSRMCLLDSLGATLAGTLTRVSQITAGYAARAWAGDQATLLLRGRRSTAVGAAFANAWTANGLDIDDGIQYAYGHAGAQLFPAALALAEARDMSGGRMLAAMVAGYEVAHRVGRCWHDHHAVYQACGSWGSVASAATAANLLELDPAQTWHALGIAEYHAPNLPMMRDIDHPAMVKHGIGWGAMTGVMSAEMAAAGFTGIPGLLDRPEYRDWAADIGQVYIMVTGVAWKSKGLACCSWAHPAIKGATQLRREHAFSPGEIAAIRIEGFHETLRLGARLPATTEEAQFNVAWPVAAALVDGEVGPAQVLEQRLHDPQLRELAGKVELVESEELNELCRLYRLGDPRGSFSGAVTIRLKDGREFYSGIVDAGAPFPQPDWDEARIEEKFRWLAGQVLDPARVDTLADMAWHFEDLASVRELTALLE